MVMCIVSATATIVLLTVAIYGACSAAKSNSMCGRRNHNYGYGFDHPYYNTPCEDMVRICDTLLHISICT